MCTPRSYHYGTGHESRWVVMFMHRTGAKWLFPPYQGILNKSITAVFYPSMSKDGPQVPDWCVDSCVPMLVGRECSQQPIWDTNVIEKN